jgi:hypothetical protein
MSDYQAVIINIETLLPMSPYSAFGADEDCRLPANRRPSFVHHDKESAEKELARLARNFPGQFVLFEAVAKGTAVQTTAGVVGRVDPLTVAPVDPNRLPRRRRRK